MRPKCHFNPRRGCRSGRAYRDIPPIGDLRRRRWREGVGEESRNTEITGIRNMSLLSLLPVSYDQNLSTMQAYTESQSTAYPSHSSHPPMDNP